MNVERQDNILRYTVESRSRVGVTHVVELDMWTGNGGCTCEHFTMTLEPKLKKGAVPRPDDPDALRCEHIKAARRKLVDDIIANAVRMETSPQPRQRVERHPPPRYTGGTGKARQRPASKRR